jgi:hypothetical protein
MQELSAAFKPNSRFATSVLEHASCRRGLEARSCHGHERRHDVMGDVLCVLPRMSALGGGVERLWMQTELPRIIWALDVG